MPRNIFDTGRVTCLALLALWPGARVEARVDPFAECVQRFQAAPRDRESASCFFDVARRRALWREGALRLQTLHDRDIDNPWLPLNLGHISLYQDLSQAEAPYREAVKIAERLGATDAEIEARIAFARLAARLGRLDEAEEVFARAVEIADQENDPMLQAAVHIRQAWQDHYRGRPDDAYHLLRGVEKNLFPAGPDHLKKQCLEALAYVCYVLGKTDESLKYKERLLSIAQTTGDLAGEAEAKLGIAIHYVAIGLPTPNTRQRVRGLLEEALMDAHSAVHPSIEGRAHRELGKMLGGDEGGRHLETCISIARDLGNLQLMSDCQGALAASVAATDPELAKRLMQQVFEATREATSLWPTAYGSVERLIVQWATLPTAAAITDSLEVLDAIEALRELQVTGSSRAGLLSLWSEVYYWLSGQLLEDQGGSTTARDPELAFHVTERMRAQVLLESLAAAQAAKPPPDADPWVQQLADVLELKVDVQRRLLERRLADREQINAELRSVESREAALRHQIAQASPTYAALRSPVATLTEIRQGLRDDEALLSYQVASTQDIYGRFAGGAWLQVATHNGHRSYRLPDRTTLEPALDAILGLPEPGTAGKGLARLYRELLGEALGDLPPEIDKLIVVPDGKLHRLPFALLRSATDADPLIARYKLSIAPSATLWLRWRKLGSPPSTVPVLAYADPLIAGQDSTAPETAGTRTQLAPLPYTRKEGKAIIRMLGGGSRLLEGPDATEHSVKTEELQQYGIIHFGAHALIDNQKPERSAVILAAGAEGEDGWLQPHEIVQLDLQGRSVVLASCDTAAGQILRGEGAMSLARAFFQAGAPVVIASLWEIPDAATSTLLEKFYRRLAQGTSVAEAMATAQREMIHRGASGREWAGLVVLGNGALIPFPNGLPKPIPYRLVVGIALAFAIFAAAVIRRRSVQN